uniref:Transport inhibitor response 1 domain-containing protein n=1 Tax=Oryza nivara TaxID=4536 RepID=A0A0E0H9G8_ORYNI
MGRGGSRAACAAAAPPWHSLPDEVWEHAFSFLPAAADRGAAAGACSSWLRAERRSRRRLAVANCYAAAPRDAVERFPSVRAAEVKGKPHFADFGLVPPAWGAAAAPWIAAAADGWPLLEELSFKRMVITDECLEMIAASFRNFQVLRLVSCDGFSTAGLAAIAAGCRVGRHLRELDLQENEIEDCSIHWLSLFPESFTSLVTLNFSCLEGEVNITVLERLVTRCHNLKTLKLNNAIPLDKLASLLHKAPQLVELGTGKFSADYHSDLFAKLEAAFGGCKSLRRLSGAWDAVPDYLPAFYCVCEGLTSLNLSYATVRGPELIKFISRCRNLQQLWVMDLIEDHGLAVVASSCNKLQELRVFPSDPFGAGFLTERGLVDVSASCPMLESVLYFCRRMTNEALITIAKNRPNFTCFRLCILEPHTPDYITREPLDAGFSAIVESCRGLRRLSISGLLTDLVFKSIGAHADRLEMLSIAFAGNSDLGLHYILSGCKSLKKLEIRDCPFGDKPLLANAAKLETMRSLWMSSCLLTLGACRQLARKMPRLSVEIMNDPGRSCPLDSLPDETPVEKLYVYRTIAGPRSDTPACVQIV